MTRNTNQLQNHPKFITVHGILAGGHLIVIPDFCDIFLLFAIMLDYLEFRTLLTNNILNIT